MKHGSTPWDTSTLLKWNTRPSKDATQQDHHSRVQQWADGLHGGAAVGQGALLGLKHHGLLLLEQVAHKAGGGVGGDGSGCDDSGEVAQDDVGLGHSALIPVSVAIGVSAHIHTQQVVGPVATRQHNQVIRDAAQRSSSMMVCVDSVCAHLRNLMFCTSDSAMWKYCRKVSRLTSALATPGHMFS